MQLYYLSGPLSNARIYILYEYSFSVDLIEITLNKNSVYNFILLKIDFICITTEIDHLIYDCFLDSF